MQITKSNERTLTYVRALVHGDSGVGKTTSIGTLPEKHTLVAVAERSIVPLRNKAFPVAQMDDWGALRTLVGELRKPFKVDGNEIRVETDEFEGRIFQHEMDHLDGILLIERLDDDQRREAKKFLRRQRIQLASDDPDGLSRLLGE